MALWTEFVILLGITAFYALLAAFIVLHILSQAGFRLGSWLDRVLRWLR